MVREYSAGLGGGRRCGRAIGIPADWGSTEGVKGEAVTPEMTFVPQLT